MKMKMDKNTKYALYFGGALLATYIVVKIIQNNKGGDEDVTPTPEKEVVYTDKYLATLPLGVEGLTWGSKIPSKYLPSFDAIASAKSDSAFKAKVARVQTLLNQRIASLGGGYPKIATDGLAGQETAKAMLYVASKYSKMDLLPLTKTSDIDKWLTFFNVKDTDTNTKTKELPWWG
jgi:hypothetical protein